MLTIAGTVVYDPFRGSQKTRTKNWCVLEVDREITRYYRALLFKSKHIRLCQPAWDAHVSIVRGEYIPNMAKWKYNQSTSIAISYDPTQIHQTKSGRLDNDTGDFYYIPIYSDDINNIRKQLGLPTYDEYHLTIGRTYA
jgi:hypothetical protein